MAALADRTARAPSEPSGRSRAGRGRRAPVPGRARRVELPRPHGGHGVPGSAAVAGAPRRGFRGAAHQPFHARLRRRRGGGGRTGRNQPSAIRRAGPQLGRPARPKRRIGGHRTGRGGGHRHLHARLVGTPHADPDPAVPDRACPLHRRPSPDARSRGPDPPAQGGADRGRAVRRAVAGRRPERAPLPADRQPPAGLQLGPQHATDHPHHVLRVAPCGLGLRRRVSAPGGLAAHAGGCSSPYAARCWCCP